MSEADRKTYESEMAEVAKMTRLLELIYKPDGPGEPAGNCDITQPRTSEV
jgi:hypothetical protein